MISSLEIVANGVAAASILLAGRNSVLTWWTGILGCTLFAVVFLQAKLYADVVLQLFFVATSALGWRQWLRGGHCGSLVVSRAPPKIPAWSATVGTATALGYGALLQGFPDAYAPFIDSVVLVFSVLAQLLRMQRRRRLLGALASVGTRERRYADE